jgi:hypothetical protein
VLSKQAAHSLGSVSMPCLFRKNVISDCTPNSLFVSTIILFTLQLIEIEKANTAPSRSKPQKIESKGSIKRLEPVRN